MSEKRRDNKGRILRTGESQRKNGMYEFRYTDANKKRRSIYDMDLMKLRQKEDEIKLLRHEGIDYAGGEITVIQLLERYISLKRGVRYNTTTGLSEGILLSSVWILFRTTHRKELHCPQSSRSNFWSLPRMTSTSADIWMKSRYCLEQECESVSFAD